VAGVDVNSAATKFLRENGGDRAGVVSETADAAPQASTDMNAVNAKAAKFVKGQTAKIASTSTKGESVTSHVLQATDPSTGEAIGHLRFTEEPGSGVTQVDNAASKLPGSGLGTRMYRQAISEAAARNPNGVFQSAGVVSTPRVGFGASWRMPATQ